MQTIQTDFNLKEFLAEQKQLIENYLEQALSTNKSASKLWEAMAYSGLNGGKRLRGILCMSVADAIKSGSSKLVLPIAAGLECIHTMSLIHDDLPCMDNDELRRGKPTCHVKFDEATALLAGDALIVEGLDLCTKADIKPEITVKIIQLVTNAIGAYGMTGGQMIDLENTNRENVTLAELEQMHKMKTGAFLKASVIAGAIAMEANESQIQALTIYAENIGLAFQIADDLLDLKSDSQTLGKTAGKDQAQNKATYPKLLGVKESEERAYQLVKDAKESLIKAQIQSIVLDKIADYIIERNY